MTATKSATVETLTAEVRVLMVGSRQVTMSVYNQLDQAAPRNVEAFGRVSPKDALADHVYVVGRHRHVGSLVSASLRFSWPSDEEADDFEPQTRKDPETGERIETGMLIWRRLHFPGVYQRIVLPADWKAERTIAEEWLDLPLIVLAGLR